jgi:hypothetical protein
MIFSENRFSPFRIMLELGVDHRPLTLTNRCRGGLIGGILSEKRVPLFMIMPMQNKTAQEHPAPLRSLKIAPTRSALRISGGIWRG